MRDFYLIAMLLYRVKNASPYGNDSDGECNDKKAFIDCDAQANSQAHQQRHHCWIEKLSSFHNASSSLLTQNYPVHHFGDNRRLALTVQKLGRAQKHLKSPILSRILTTWDSRNLVIFRHSGNACAVIFRYFLVGSIRFVRAELGKS